MSTNQPSNTHGVKDLVISCIDYRFRPKVAAWIEGNLTNQADLVAVGGTSKAFIDPASQEYVLGLIKIGVNLHGVTTIHLLDHMDCGAYGGSKQHTNNENEIRFHQEKLLEAEQVIKSHFPTLTINQYIMTFSGVEKVSTEPVRA